MLVEAAKKVPRTLLPGSPLRRKMKRKLARQERQREKALDGEGGPSCQAVARSEANDAVSDGATTGEEEDTDTSSSSAVVKSPLDRLVEPPVRMKKFEGCDPRSVNLYDCLDSFVAKLALITVKGDGYDCEACNARTMNPFQEKGGKGRGVVKSHKKKQDAAKRLFLLGNPPGILVCHLNRLQAKGKITRNVKFDLEIDISPYFWHDPQVSHVAMETRYRLFGVVQHMGGHLGGHYVAYFRDTDGWKHASDSMVRTATLQEVKDCQAYMLFYERCDLVRPAN